MAMSIRNNLSAMHAERSVAGSQLTLDRSLTRLSSGYRVNSGADDPAGLAISERMRTQMAGLNQAIRNSNDGISMIQTAEGALQEVHNMLKRIRELAVQAANDTLSTTDRDKIKTEVQALRDEINGISSRTKFNGKNLLTGSLVTTQDTAASGLDEGASFTRGGTAIVSDIDVSAARSGESFTFTINTTTTVLTFTRVSDSVTAAVTLGATAASAESTLDFTSIGLKIKIQNSSAGSYTAANLALDFNDIADKDIVTATGTGSANLQIGAEASDYVAVAFNRVDVSSSGLSDLNTSITAFLTGDVTVAEAEDLITKADSATGSVSENRASLGASQNRLEYTVSSLQVSLENMTAAESRIRDVDVASETASMARSQVLAQAAISVLAQANQLPQLALRLLS